LPGDGLFQGRFVTNDADRVIVDLHPVYDRLNMGLSERRAEYEAKFFGRPQATATARSGRTYSRDLR
jgi:hypothetical protein